MDQTVKQGYWIENGKICTPGGCELNAVQHCNLTCRSCSHLSPVLAKQSVRPDEVFHDFSILAKYYRPQNIKIVGGEPLLHRDLVSVIKALRESKICQEIIVSTNGLLLPRVPQAFWEVVNTVMVSVYPGQELPLDELLEVKRCAMASKTKLFLKPIPYFRAAYSERGVKNVELIHQIYASCKIAHEWRCHTVHEGYFHKCPPNVFIPKVVDHAGIPPHTDSVEIRDAPSFAQELRVYLESAEPLAACQYCLGTAGKLHVNEQVGRRNWRTFQQRPLEDLVDHEKLVPIDTKVSPFPMRQSAGE